MNTTANTPTRPDVPARALAVFLALCFLSMLFAALAGNFGNPRQNAQRTPEQTAAMPAGMENNIGMLMQRAAREPDNLNLLMELTEALVAAQSWDAAETFAKRGVTLNTQDHRPLYLLGVILHNKGQHKEAAEAFERAIAIESTAPLHYSLGVLLTYFLQDPQHGLEHFTIALNAPDADEELKQAIRRELNKRSSPAQTEKAAPAPQAAPGGQPPLSRETAQKITELEKAALRNPRDAAAWTNLGNLYFDAGMKKEAISAYERSLQLAPDDPNVLTDMGIMHRDTGNFARAIECFRKASTLNPRHENALFNQGVVFYYDLGQKEEAERAWRRLLEINPGARAPDGQPVSEMIKHLH
ncbi:MAG: tetratricopeptide repeat protein [Desulfovibrio sp.]|jgi:tetratricopeptide (TPR) repeat protein|nr:tetratricopeptide repeat protein [Desulfovibrio sp.]